MTRQAAALYDLLYSNRGRLVTYEQIRQAIATGSSNYRNYIWLLVYEIRNHMPPRQEIRCEYARGYRLVVYPSRSLVAA